MVTMESIIKTGVDRLVDLIKEKGKITITDAANSLGVSRTTIEEWTDFLEEEGIVRIEYKLTTPYLTLRKLTKKDVETKAKEFHGKKDIFVRKAESMLSYLGKEAKELKLVKAEFDKLKKELGLEVGAVKSELKDLEKYGELKKDIDAQMLKQKQDFIKKMDEINNMILKEQRKYQQIINEVEEEEKKLEEERLKESTIEENEKKLKERIKEFGDMIVKIKKNLQDEDKKIIDTKNHIKRLKDLAKKFKEEMKKERKRIIPLIEKSKQQESKILELQKEVTKKIEGKEKTLKATKGISDKFKEFFEKKMKTEELVNRVNEDRDELEKELVDLIKKAKSFQLSSKSSKVGDQIVELEKKFEEIDEKKNKFEEELKRLTSLLSRKK